MVQKLEATKGGGGSIRIGSTGTISSLMRRELESSKSTPQMTASSWRKTRAVPVSDSCGASAPKKMQPRKSSDEASSSCAANGSPEVSRKMKSYTRNTHRIPMLNSNGIPLDITPNIQKTEKKSSSIVEIVDIKCGHQDRAWASPITNRLKKLGFSKLSESII